MASQNSYDRFFSSPSFGVVGASNDRSKFGNKVLRKYLSSSLKAYPINPHEKNVEGIDAFASVIDLPSETKSISIITPPAVTEKIIEEALQKGVQNIWMQPGAESLKAIEECKKAGINVIADGSCILVTLK